jgi:hypothetical protein
MMVYGFYIEFYFLGMNVFHLTSKKLYQWRELETVLMVCPEGSNTIENV